jgi:hypothetical protein
MGFMDRFFSKKELEKVQDLEREFENIVKNAQADFIALVGISGKAKGLDIINVLSPNPNVDATQLKRYAAKLVEVYLRLQSLELVSSEVDTPLQYFQLNYTEQLNFCLIPIPGNDLFVLIAVSPNITKILKSLEKEKVHDKLNQLFPPKGE